MGAFLYGRVLGQTRPEAGCMNKCLGGPIKFLWPRRLLNSLEESDDKADQAHQRTRRL